MIDLQSIYRQTIVYNHQRAFHMFGILRPAADSLGIQDKKDYAERYCSLCGCLSEHYGVTTRLLLMNDVVTLLWLFGKEETVVAQRYCRANCLRGGTLTPQTRRSSAVDRYAAALSVLLYRIKVEDDEQDAKTPWTRFRHWSTNAQERHSREVLAELAFPIGILEGALADQCSLETSSESDFLKASDPTARCYGLVSEHLVQLSSCGIEDSIAREIGSGLGRLVYLIDAFRDRLSDVGMAYNPFLCERQKRVTSVPPGRLREFDAALVGVLKELDILCTRAGQRLFRRWVAVRTSLVSYIRRDPESVTLNMICCCPCGDGAVAVDTKECNKTLERSCCFCLCLMCIGRCQP